MIDNTMKCCPYKLYISEESPNQLNLKTVNSTLVVGLVYCLFCYTTASDITWHTEDVEELPVAPNPDDFVDVVDKNHTLLMGDINICANVADNVLLPVYGNCSKLYLCENNQAKRRTCTEGRLFDYRSQACSEVMTPDECLPGCGPSVSSFCYDNTCSKYVLCYDSYPVLRECQDGLQYNADTDRCDFPQYVDCVANLCSYEDRPENILYIPSKASCEKYYICAAGKVWNQTCANGLQFSKDCDCCNYAETVNCTVAAVQRNIKSFARSPPRRADIDCPATGYKFLPHATRRDAYYYCLNGRGITLDCTPGLLYDAEVQECRQPQYIRGVN